MLKGREQSRLTWQVLRQVLDGVVSEWEVRMYGVYILSSDYLCSNPTLPLNNYRNRKIFNVSVLPHQIVKMIKWTIKKMHVHEPSKVWLSKSMCPMSRGLWDSKLPVFSQDTVVGCDLANQWFSVCKSFDFPSRQQDACCGFFLYISIPDRRKYVKRDFCTSCQDRKCFCKGVWEISAYLFY